MDGAIPAQDRSESPGLPLPRAGRLADFSADRRVLLLAAMAAIIGAVGALAALALLKLIGLVGNLVWFGRWATAPLDMAAVPRTGWIVAAPVLGGLVIGLMARYGSEKIRGHGIPEAIEAILIGGSRMSPRVAVLKPISSAISIGTGGPFGAEGPIIMTGGALGSLFAQFFHLSAAERKTLLVAGAAAGMTAVFGTPLAAVLLAVELLLFEWKPRSFIPVVSGVAVSFALRPLLIGSGALFPAQFVLPDGLMLLPLAAVAGIAAGLQSGLMTTLLYRIEDAFERLPVHWMWWPALGGIAVGLGGLIDPRALGVGYDVIGDLLDGRMLWQGVLSILLVKSAIWLVSLSSGTSGGVLAPLLILGGALGWLLGLHLPGGGGLWALVGMAAMMGGTMRAPLTGAIFAVELTGDLAALPLLLVATTCAYAVTVLLLRRSILTEKIARRGQHITREYAIDPFEAMRAADIMTRDVATLPASMPATEAATFFGAEPHAHRAYPVVGEGGRLAGIVTRAEALQWLQKPPQDGLTLYDLTSDNALPCATPDATVAHIVDLMLATDTGRVPIVDAKGRLAGLVARKDILRLRAASGALESEREAFFRGGRKAG